MFQHLSASSTIFSKRKTQIRQHSQSMLPPLRSTLPPCCILVCFLTYSCFLSPSEEPIANFSLDSCYCISHLAALYSCLYEPENAAALESSGHACLLQPEECAVSKSSAKDRSALGSKPALLSFGSQIRKYAYRGIKCIMKFTHKLRL